MYKNTLIPAQNPENYTVWLIDLKARIRGAQAKAAFAANQELVLLYWHIGREILDRQTAQGWGTKMDRCGICARGACTITLVSPDCLARQNQNPERARMVRQSRH